MTYVRRLKVASLILFAFAFLLYSPAVVSAHVHKADNGVDVELHIPPSDAPKSGEHTTLRFEFSNESGAAFSLSDYRVSVSVLDGTRDVVATALHSTGDDIGTVDVVFPKAGTYSIAVTGESSTGKPAFSVHYEVTVAAGVAAPVKKSSKTASIAGVIITLVVIAGLTAVRYLFNKRSASKHLPK